MGRSTTRSRTHTEKGKKEKDREREKRKEKEEEEELFSDDTSLAEARGRLKKVVKDMARSDTDILDFSLEGFNACETQQLLSMHVYNLLEYFDGRELEQFRPLAMQNGAVLAILTYSVMRISDINHYYSKYLQDIKSDDGILVVLAVLKEEASLPVSDKAAVCTTDLSQKTFCIFDLYLDVVNGVGVSSEILSGLHKIPDQLVDYVSTQITRLCTSFPAVDGILKIAALLYNDLDECILRSSLFISSQRMACVTSIS